MTIEEIYNKLAIHMYEGTMYHEEMAKAYDFLGLWGFSKCHRYHVIEEKQGLECLFHYYATHYFKIIPYSEVPRPKVIPDTWYKYSAQAVDNSTKKSAIKDLMNKWVEWEKSTKQLYQEMRQELTTIGELAAAIKLDEYICDVSSELHDAEKMLLRLEAINYDLIAVMEWQDKLHKKYKKKIGW